MCFAHRVAHRSCASAFGGASGTEYATALVKVAYFVLTAAMVLLLLAAALVTTSCGGEADSDCELAFLRASSDLKLGLATGGLLLWLTSWFVLVPLFRRPYLHIGVPVGGGARGRANPFGGASPFYIRLAAKDMASRPTTSPRLAASYLTPLSRSAHTSQ